MKKANHVCCNKKCGKEYYSCDWCAKTEGYRKVTCSTECYQEYALQWLDAHPNTKFEDTNFALPIEIGKTKQETIQHMREIESKPIEQVEAETKQELSDMGYAEEVESLGISGTVDLINSELAEGLAEDEATANENVNDNTAPKSFNFKKSKVKD